MKRRNLLIASTSTVYGQPYLEYINEEIRDFFSSCNEILFIPYARPGGISYDQYWLTASKFFEANDMTLRGIHQKENYHEALHSCDGIFTGGGNTFLLLKTLYDMELISLIKSRISEGIPYMGTSAGSNILGLSIGTTNDMPIVFPPSFKAIGAVPFNINPHYIDTNPDMKHKGESRETRIKEFLVFNNTPVVGLREGSYFKVKGDGIRLGGKLKVRVFQKGEEPMELGPDENFSFLLMDR